MMNTEGFMKSKAMLILFGCVGAASTWASPIIYANNAGEPHIDVIDGATMTVTSDFLINGGSGNGRGVVVVGDTLYYTLANSGTVFKHNLLTNAEGTAFTVAGASGLSTIAYDGADFWIGDYSGTNQAYHYTPTGTLLSTVHLGNCTGFCDGLEFFLQNGQGRLISNRGDSEIGPYDVYDTSGNLVQAAFITTTFGATGIAFDGTNFWVSDRTSQKLALYNGTTGALISDRTITGTTFGLNVEDLSVDYTLVLPPPTGVPEPSTWLLLSSGLGLVLLVSRRRRFQNLS
jgi:hypothetical protein